MDFVLLREILEFVEKTGVPMVGRWPCALTDGLMMKSSTMLVYASKRTCSLVSRAPL